MRLLPKSEVDKAKALDRQREIEEGKKLATRVDTLRDTHAKEEAELQSFRSKTLAQIQIEVNGEIERLEDVKREVNEKRQELFSLSGPLDKAWKYYITSEKTKIALEKSEIERLNVQLQIKIDQNSLLSEEMFAEKRSYLLGQTENIRDRVLAKSVLTQAEDSASKMSDKTKLILTEAEKKRIEVQRLLDNSKEREKSLVLYENRLKQKEDELETREMEALAKELLYYSPVKKN